MKKIIDDDVIPNEAGTSERPELLARIIETEDAIQDASKKEIVFADPLVSWSVADHSAGIVRTSGIVVIQGQKGVHKSRFAEQLASCLICRKDIHGNFLKLETSEATNFVVYIDTERNTAEELPAAVQRMKRNAGYRIEDKLQHFRTISLKNLDMEEKRQALNDYLQYIRAEMRTAKVNDNLIVFVDVLTDIAGINDAEKSISTINYLNQLSEKFGTCFVLVIHENPGSEKARGHTGTEVVNKASAVLSLSKQRDGNGVPTNLIKLSFVHLRNSAGLPCEYLEYDADTNLLKLADANTARKARETEAQTGSAQKVIQTLQDMFRIESKVYRMALFARLISEHGISEATAKRSVKSILDTGFTIDCGHMTGKLHAYMAKGAETYYTLKEDATQKTDLDTEETTDEHD